VINAEHFLPFLRPGGSKLFHGRRGWHRSGRFPADLQLLLAGFSARSSRDRVEPFERNPAVLVALPPKRDKTERPARGLREGGLGPWDHDDAPL